MPPYSAHSRFLVGFPPIFLHRSWLVKPSSPTTELCGAFGSAATPAQGTKGTSPPCYLSHGRADHRRGVSVDTLLVNVANIPTLLIHNWKRTTFRSRNKSWLTEQPTVNQLPPCCLALLGVSLILIFRDCFTLSCPRASYKISLVVGKPTALLHGVYRSVICRKIIGSLDRLIVGLRNASGLGRIPQCEVYIESSKSPCYALSRCGATPLRQIPRGAALGNSAAFGAFPVVFDASGRGVFLGLPPILPNRTLSPFDTCRAFESGPTPGSIYKGSPPSFRDLGCSAHWGVPGFCGSSGHGCPVRFSHHFRAAPMLRL